MAETRRRRWWQRRPHQHYAAIWDGYYEHCRCGACSGDRRDPVTGLRCISFSDWPVE